MDLSPTHDRSGDCYGAGNHPRTWVCPCLPHPRKEAVMPAFVTVVQAWARHRPGRAFLALLALGVVVYWLFLPSAPSVRATVPRPQGVPGVGADKSVFERTLLDVQKSNEELRVKLDAQELATRQLKQAQVSAEHDRQAAAQAHEQQLTALRQQ